MSAESKYCYKSTLKDTYGRETREELEMNVALPLFYRCSNGWENLDISIEIPILKCRLCGAAGPLDEGDWVDDIYLCATCVLKRERTREELMKVIRKLSKRDLEFLQTALARLPQTPDVMNITVLVRDEEFKEAAKALEDFLRGLTDNEAFRDGIDDNWTNDLCSLVNDAIDCCYEIYLDWQAWSSGDWNAWVAVGSKEEKLFARLRVLNKEAAKFTAR